MSHTLLIHLKKTQTDTQSGCIIRNFVTEETIHDSATPPGSNSTLPSSEPVATPYKKRTPPRPQSTEPAARSMAVTGQARTPIDCGRKEDKSWRAHARVKLKK